MKHLNYLKILGSRERTIIFDVKFTETNYKKPLVIFCHGFKGFKDWGHFNLLAERLADSNFVVTKFNFSFNGGNETQIIDFPDLEAFGNNNISTELNDLGVFIDAWSKSNQFISDEEVDRTNIILIGHSRGGGVCILKAAEDSRVKKLITLASINHVGRLFQDEDFLQEWKNEGVIYVPNARTNQEMPMYYQYYEDYLENKNRLDIPNAAKKIQIPWLIIHGDADSTVPVSAAIEMHDLNKNSELFVLANANHTFGGLHPWSTQNLPEDTSILVEKTVAFIND
jgi:pimeloyl-ACP methyl ester carboxylesterase